MATSFDSLVQSMNPAWLGRHGLIPIALADDRLVVAAPEACSSQVLAALRFAAGCEVEIVPAPQATARGEVGPSLADRIVTAFGLSGQAAPGTGHLAELAAIAIPVAFAWHGISITMAILVGGMAILAGVCLRVVMRAEAGPGDRPGAAMDAARAVRHGKAIMHAIRVAGAALFAVALVVLVQR